MTDVDVRMESGAALAPVLPALARLRVAVFRDWPYLYDGDESYEARYLGTYAASPRAGIAVARAGDAVIGASTCLPLAEAQGEVRAALAGALPEAETFYFGESVLLPAWRGRGLGVRFFALREERARAHGARFTAFCAVKRAPDHPLRPIGAVGLDAFWAHRGYTIRPDLVCRMAWKDIDAADETEKELVFWTRAL